MGFQLVFNVCVLTLVARWYVAPRLARLPRHEALVPPILVHLVRPISLWLLVPGVVVRETLDRSWALSTAAGDLVATALALAAVLALRRGHQAGVALAWVFNFNVVGLLDALKNGAFAARLGVPPHMGPAVLVPAYPVAALLVSHGLVFWLLLRREPAVTPAAGP
jgi:hypothetical protein